MIPDLLDTLKKLKDLDLALNDLYGSISSLLTELTSLTQLELYNNSLSDELPRGMGKLTVLRLPDASMNHLTGRIPEDLCSLPLESLNLYENRFEGELPASIADPSNLYELRLFGNRLTGKLPENFGKRSLLRWLDVSNNQFWRPILTTLCDLRVLEELLLIYNLFFARDSSKSGHVPELDTLSAWFQPVVRRGSSGDMGPATRVPARTRSQLVLGSIARTIAEARNLSVLILSKNNFSGAIVC